MLLSMIKETEALIQKYIKLCLNEETSLVYNKYKINSYSLVILIIMISGLFFGITPLLFTVQLIFEKTWFALPYYFFIYSGIIFLTSLVLFLYKSYRYKVFKKRTHPLIIVGLFVLLIIDMYILALTYCNLEHEEGMYIIEGSIFAYIKGFLISVICAYIFLLIRKFLIGRLKEINITKDISQSNNDTH